GISHADPLLNHKSVAREHEEWQKCPRGISHRGSLVEYTIGIERLKYCPEENTGLESNGAAISGLKKNFPMHQV
ncbi:hypothetical protein ALC56_05150, partial [Trachymyrmex septentrionalis]